MKRKMRNLVIALVGTTHVLDYLCINREISLYQAMSMVKADIALSRSISKASMHNSISHFHYFPSFFFTFHHILQMDNLGMLAVLIHGSLQRGSK